MAPALASLLLALLVTPYLLVRNLAPRTAAVPSICFAGAVSIIINTAAPILLHVRGIPINRTTLTVLHALSGALLIAITILRRLQWLPAERKGLRACVAVSLLFCLLVLPYTHLAGIDTYKWQGLATTIRVEQSIPWLIHPLSLLGFTPRAYPASQPLVLATIQIMSQTGVDWGYFLFSALSGTLGIFCAFFLGQRVFGGINRAGWFAFFYAFSPVFVRYNHWATGRGLFLALLPLFLAAMLETSVVRRWAGMIFAGLLLPLAHKTGLAVFPLGIVSLAGGSMLPRGSNRTFLTVIVLPFLAASVLLSPRMLLPSPAGLIAGFAWKAATRFGWYLPLAAVGWLGPANWLTSSPLRSLATAAMLSLPAAFISDMYGALVALPFVTLAAASGFFWLRERLALSVRTLNLIAGALTLAAALIIVVNRSINATPPRIREAARFLEEYDPRGPYDIVSPLRARVQIHAYVSGCPRFEIIPGPEASISFRTAPKIGAPLPEVLRAWIDYGRNIVALNDIEVFWYGRDPRSYYLTVDGEGCAPADSRCIYERHGVTLHEPAGQQRRGSP